MKRISAPVLAGLLMACLFSVGVRPASPDEIRVLSNNNLQPALLQLAAEFKKETGHDVKLETPAGPELIKMLASDEPADILIGTAAVVDQAVKDGKVAGTKTMVGRVGIGVMVRRGVTPPNVATAADIKQAVLSADAVAYSTAGSGQFMEKLFAQMGVSDQIKAKVTRPGNGPTTMEHVIGGTGNEIGFGVRTEMTPFLEKGLQFVALLPDDLQNYTNYDAAVLARTKSSDVATAFIRYITTPAAKKIFLTTGVN